MASSIKALVVALILATAAHAAEPTYDDLKQQLTQLQARLDALEQKQRSGDDEVAATLREIVRDANQRSKLLVTDGLLTAGYDKGFFIRSNDGNFTLKPGLLFQFRNITNAVTGDDDSIENGFEVRRLRPRVGGNLFSPDFTYLFVLDVSRSSGNTAMLDALVAYKFSKDWSLKAGQFRNSWVHEGDTSDANQLTVERSLNDAILAGSQTDRVQGIAVVYGGLGKQPIRFEGTFHDGANSKNTNFEDVNTNFGLSGRVEYRLSGNWADYRDFSARATKKELLILGAGADWTQAEGLDVLRPTVDAQFETASRWGFYGALHGVMADDDQTNFSWGALVQVGYAINQRFEPFFRYDLVSIDDSDTGQDTYNEFTAGVGWYLGENGSAGTRAKVTVDLIYLPEGAPSNQTGTGVIASEDAQFVFRTQFQLML